MKAPFPWFGGKSRVAPIVWQRFGAVRNYVEPFFGSGAVLLGRPDFAGTTETVNDKDGLLANFWRAVKADPSAVAKHADNPVNECDLHAKHSWLVRIKDDFVPSLMGDANFFDAEIAGAWVWGLCCWIGSGWCSGNGPWQSVDGKLTKATAGRGVKRTRVHLNGGQGVNRKRVHLGNAGQGVNRQLVHLGDAGRGVNLIAWMKALSERLERVRVCCGDWQRVCGSTPTRLGSLNGVFLDPPYSREAKRDNSLYREESGTVAHDVRAWAIEHGDDPKMRIALCGYEGEYTMPKSWTCVPWKAHGGYGTQAQAGAGRENAHRERIWFNQHCLKDLPERAVAHA